MPMPRGARRRLALGVQPGHLRRRPARRLPGAAPRRPERGLRHRPARRAARRSPAAARARRRAPTTASTTRRSPATAAASRSRRRRRTSAPATCAAARRSSSATSRRARRRSSAARAARAARSPTTTRPIPAISRDGRYVAFSSAARNLGGAPNARLAHLRPRPAHAPHDAPSAAADGFALKPSISADGRVVAYTSIRGRAVARARPRRARPRRRAARLARDRPRGAAADGSSSDATISADGRRVAFTSAATNLAAGKPDDRRGVFVRDLRARDDDARQRARAEGRAAAAAAPRKPAVGPEGVARRASCRGAARRCRARRSSRSSTTRSSAAATGRRSACARAACSRGAGRRSSPTRSRVRSGPQPLRSPTKTAGVYSARLDEAGHVRRSSARSTRRACG